MESAAQGILSDYKLVVGAKLGAALTVEKSENIHRPQKGGPKKGHPEKGHFPVT